MDNTLTNAPKSIGGFVCGLLGFILCGAPLVGLILSIVGTALCGSAKKAARQHPSQYKGNGYIIAGQVLGIIGIVCSSIMTVMTVIWGIIMGEGLFYIWDMVFGY